MLVRAFFAMLFSGLLLSGWSCMASAHAHLVKSEPIVGAVLSSPPKRVQIWFSSILEADFSSIQIMDASDKRVDGNDTTLSDKDSHILRVTLPGDLKPGKYRVTWKAASTDGHKTTGNFPFTVR